MKYIKEIHNPDGYEKDGTPYWFLIMTNKKTYSYEEWLKQERLFWGCDKQK